MKIANQHAAKSHLAIRSCMLLFVGSLAAAAGGCRSATDNQIDLLERELRMQEDYIYELEDNVMAYSQKLRACRCAMAESPHFHAKPDGADSPGKSSSTLTKRLSKQVEPSETDPPSAQDEDELPLPPEPEPDVEESEPISPEDMEIPELEIDDPVGDVQHESNIEQASTDDWDVADMLALPEPADFSVEGVVEQARAEQLADELFENAAPEIDNTQPAAPRVAQELEITQIFRGGNDKTAPESLLALVEALDDRGEPVDLNGKVALMVMTSDADSPERLKRWDFSPTETAEAWQSSELGDGLHLELPLDDDPLPDAPLELWARLVLDDGRKLLTQVAFEPTALATIDQALPPVDHPSEDRPQLAAAEPLPRNAVLEPQKQTLPLVSKAAGDEPPLVSTTTNESRPTETRKSWRPSMQRTDQPVQSYSTTSQDKQRWQAQPIGGRLLPASLARRTTDRATRPTTTQPTSLEESSGPKWTPYR